jgi:hypothetical protein
MLTLVHPEVHPELPRAPVRRAGDLQEAVLPALALAATIAFGLVALEAERPAIERLEPATRGGVPRGAGTARALRGGCPRSRGRATRRPRSPPRRAGR